ncbi:replication initiation regulator SeqA [Colwellia sp. 39_35_sub15_T18]|nr:replication initiation regulator SeqA [Colwellia sp. 39_35_sub15_T18]
MKNIEIDEELYQYIVSNTQAIGESASSILRRLLSLGEGEQVLSVAKAQKHAIDNSEETLTAIQAETLTARQVEPTTDTQASSHNAQAGQPVSQPVRRPASQESVFNFINKEELAMQRGAVGRFLLILAALYRAHPEQFNVVTNIAPKESARKNKRLYFAHSEAELAASGSSTKPKQIPESPFWVMTNSNTTRKKMMLTKAAMSLGYGVEEVEKIRDLL